MSRRKIKAGSTSVMLPIFVQDSSATDGSGLGALVYNTSSLAARYRRAGASSWTPISLVTATLGTFASGGFVSSGGVTGSYEVGIPDAALAAGARWVEIEYYGAANMLAVKIEIELDAVDYQDATAFGLANLNAAVGSRSSHTAADVWTAANRSLTDKVGFALDAAYDAAKTAAQAGDEMDLVDSPNVAARTAFANAMEAAILNEGDATALLAAIAAKVEQFLINDGDASATLAAIAAACNTAVSSGAVGTGIAALQTSLAGLGSPLQAGSYVAPDNAGIAAAATAAASAQAAAEAASAAAATAATEGEVQTIVDQLKGAGWTAETLKAIFDKPGAELTELQIAAIATAVATATITAIGADGVAVSELLPAALAAVRNAVQGAVVVSTSPWGNKAGYISPRLGVQYGAAIGRRLGSVYSAVALPWVTEGAAYLDITVGQKTVTFSGTASIAGGQITTDFECVAADWGTLTHGEGYFVAYQIVGGERWDIEGGRASVKPREGL